MGFNDVFQTLGGSYFTFLSVLAFVALFTAYFSIRYVAHQPTSLGIRIAKRRVWYFWTLFFVLCFGLVGSGFILLEQRINQGTYTLDIERLRALGLFFLIVLGFSLTWFIAKLLAYTLNKYIKAGPNTILMSTWVAWMIAIWITLDLTGVKDPVWQKLSGFTFQVGNTSSNAAQVLQSLLWLVLALLLAFWVTGVVASRLKRNEKLDETAQRLYLGFLRLVLLTVGVLAALSLSGVNLTLLSVVGGAFGVGLGLGLQRIAANYISGFVLLAERSLRIGDMVRIDNVVEGRVQDIATRYCLIRSLTGTETMVPNEYLMTNPVTNLSFSDSQIVLTTRVGVSYKYSSEEVIPLILAAVTGAPRVLKDPAPTVNLLEFGESRVIYMVYFWIDDPQNGQISAISGVNLAIWESLLKHEIEIPFPQRVVHIKSDKNPQNTL
jgi:small-conductance mechanosensitive channel